MCTVDVHLKRSKNLIDFLVKYDTLAVSHQNQAATSGIFPGLPESWITWAKRGSNSWRDIVRVYQSDASSLEFKNASVDMPPDLVAFIQDCVSLPLPRKPFFVPGEGTAPPERMNRVSPKKIHEVFTMSSYVSSMFNSTTNKPRIVDIGAGQGYLSRALSSDNFHVLALDSSDSQTEGSISRKDWLATESETPGAEGDAETGTITHKTTHIGDTESLSRSIEEWITPLGAEPSRGSPTPIVLIGLHCCGDLTPSILRFVQHSLHNPHSNFEIVGCVIVGCCYNMCSPTTFPVSQYIRNEISIHGPLTLLTQHLHLATQSPLTWWFPSPHEKVDPYSAINDISLSIRKVTYRALLSRRLPPTYRVERDTPLTRTDLGEIDWRTNRIGRLGTGAFKDFPTFLKVAKEKLGVERDEGRSLGVIGYDLESDLNDEERDLIRALEVFYVLRCLLGPVIESLVAMDRYAFLQEMMESVDSSSKIAEKGLVDGVGKVELVNLFDQFTGSLRNLALVWTKQS